jgi:hypothetical protein
MTGTGAMEGCCPFRIGPAWHGGPRFCSAAALPDTQVLAPGAQPSFPTGGPGYVPLVKTSHEMMQTVMQTRSAN